MSAINDQTLNRIYNRIDNERKEDREIANDALVSNMIKQVERLAPMAGITTMATKGIATSASSQIKNINKIVGNSDVSNGVGGLSPDQLKQLEQINGINKVTNHVNLEVSPYAKALGEIAGLASVVQQVSSARMKAKESDDISGNLEKSIHHLKNGGKFFDIAAPLGAGTLRSGMTAASALAAGSWLHDMATTGVVSDLSSNALTMSNPGMMASGLFGGVQGLGHATGWLGSKALGGAAWASGSGTLGKAAGMLGSLDPTTAGILGTLTMVGTSMGIKKVMDNMIKNSPLTSNKRQSRWNLSHNFVNGGNPVQLANYMQANNMVKQLSSLNAINTGETQIISKLNEIAFYTSVLQDMYNDQANRGLVKQNNGTRALNEIDKDGVIDLSGRDMQNAFRNGKISSTMQSYLKHNEGLKYIFDLFNPGTYIKSLTGQNVAPGQFKLREALHGGDPDGAEKDLAREHRIPRGAVPLLHLDISSAIANADKSYEGRMLAASVYQLKYLQFLSIQSIKNGANGSNGLIGELKRLQDIRDKESQKHYSLLIDGTLKPIMESLATVRGLSMAVPLLHGATYAGKTLFGAAKGTLNFGKNMFSEQGRADNWSGLTSGWRELRSQAIDSQRSDDIKNEAQMRTRLHANALSLQDRAYMYIANKLPEDMQKLQWLLGSTEKAKVQDRYTGDFVTPDELRKRYRQKEKDLLKARGEMNEPETYMDEAKRWFQNKIFRIKPKDIKNSTFKDYEFFENLRNEFKTPGEQLNQDQNNQFRINNGGNNFASKKLNSTLSFLNNTIKNSFSGGNGSKNGPLSYYSMMSQYIPMLQEIRDSVAGVSGTSNQINQTPKGWRNPFTNNPNNINKPKGFKIQDIINGEEIKDRETRFYETFFHQIVYLEKIYDVLKPKKGFKSGIHGSEDEEKNGGKDKDSSSVISTIGGALAGLLGLGAAKKYFNGKLGNFKDFFKGNFNKETAKGFGSKAWEVTKDVGSKAWEGFKSNKLVTNLFESLKTAGKGTLFKSGPMKILGLLLAAAGIASAAETGDPNNPEEKSTPELLMEKFKKTEFGKKVFDYYDNFTNIISDAFTKGWVGIKDFTAEIWENTKTTAGNAWSGVKDFFGVSDPATENDIAKRKNNPNNVPTKPTKQNDPSQKYLIDSINGRDTSSQNITKPTAPISNTDKINFLNKYIEDITNEKIKQRRVLETEQTPEDLKKLHDSLESLKDSSISNNRNIEQIVQTNNNMNSTILNSLFAQVNSLNNTNRDISNSLLFTAKLNTKPRIHDLDPTVLDMLPGLK